MQQRTRLKAIKISSGFAQDTVCSAVYASNYILIYSRREGRGREEITDAAAGRVECMCVCVSVVNFTTRKGGPLSLTLFLSFCRSKKRKTRPKENTTKN